ncbi:MAG: hypothetical protein ACK5WO_16655 [Cyclobacteriaceae bacterium]|jgi:hypothetical protein
MKNNKLLIESKREAESSIVAFSEACQNHASKILEAYKSLEIDSQVSESEIMKLVQPKHRGNYVYDMNDSDLLSFLQGKIYAALPATISVGGLDINKEAVLSVDKIETPEMSSFAEAVNNFRNYLLSMFQSFAQSNKDPMHKTIYKVFFKIQNGRVVLNEQEIHQTLEETKVFAEGERQIKAFSLSDQIAAALNQLMAMDRGVEYEISSNVADIGHFVSRSEVVKWDYETKKFVAGSRFVKRF